MILFTVVGRERSRGRDLPWDDIIRPTIYHLVAEDEEAAEIIASRDHKFKTQVREDTWAKINIFSNIRAVAEPHNHVCPYEAEVYQGENCELCDDFDKELQSNIEDIELGL